MEENTKILVVSAHAADYVWRAGGTIARYLERGAQVEVVVLSLGVRGESNDLWKRGARDEDEVKAVRRAETGKAAVELGLDGLDIWDLRDYPIKTDEELEDRMVMKIRKTRPDIILTHDRFDILNPDHNQVSDFVLRCSVMSNSRGVAAGGTETTAQMGIFGFEPHQTELSNYKPGCFIDITESFDKKVRAMECFGAQGHLIQYYKDRASMRGNHARRLSGNEKIRYAESFAPFFPYVSDRFVSEKP